ncbi:fatty acid desaturase [Vibrio sp. CAU 1672]|uniref:fatty acid desaturase n=1 Tax=Vibrio sp. CAU 1672 TaxID=3032594 RepID=UPI0023D97B6C|nr:fatty acid desaturase [Vibrio sp. CAU 1672]MDF2155418.1 fatty acid desaturase [Vibrio sp. CAU 1672]
MKHNTPPILWLNIVIFTSSFLLTFFVTPWYAYQYGLAWPHLVWLIIAFSFTNLSITAGYHRLWSHKTYNAHPLLRIIFAVGGAFSLQNSALHWASDHRVHHKHVDDNDRDPYSAKRGFWFSHIGWMLRDYNNSAQNDYTNCRDLKRDKIVMWQHKHYVPLAIATNLGFPIALGLIHGDIVGMWLVVCAVRLFLSHHTTFFINSLAHIWGKQTFTDRNTARDNGLLAFFTFGEGYHNFHHLFENDYRNGIYWWQYDPTKWLIKGCSWIGMTSKLRTTSTFRIEKARATQMLKQAKQKLQAKPNAQSLMYQLQAEFDSFISQMQEYYEIRKQLMEEKTANVVEKYERSVLLAKYQQIQQKFRHQQRSWTLLVRRYG